MLLYIVMLALDWPDLRVLLYHAGGRQAYALMILASAVLHQAGMLMLCWPEGRYPDKLASWRIIAWTASAVIVAYAVADAVFHMAYVFLGFGYGMYIIWGYAYGIIYLANAALVWAILRPLARRLPSRRLVTTLNFMLILIAACAVLDICPFPSEGAVIGLLWAKRAFITGAILLLARFAWAFRKAAISAEREWGRPQET